ncbi:MAG TPA: DNA alkylation repair protein [Nitrospiraceae bacterium]|jgi:3-methyladenine DNA glycosylase AlkD|nr:DNA alkylation repair protein [Nitrospiraceae bacterium]
MLPQLKKELRQLADPHKAEILSGFFKTAKGQYGEGDCFLGITVPQQRQIAKKYQNLSLRQLQELLSSRIHEYRLIALLILISKYRTADDSGREEICFFYLNNTKQINNWDLVDLSAHHILGNYLREKDSSILRRLAKSENLWERRIAIMSTFAFIKEHRFEDTLHLAALLLNDKHDLIHKAVGWMLREIGKKDQKVEEQFLRKHYQKMPRIMLRYAIERFDKRKRRAYLQRI